MELQKTDLATQLVVWVCPSCGNAPDPVASALSHGCLTGNHADFEGEAGQ